MAAHTRTASQLLASNHDQHIDMLVRHWNEPEDYEVDESTVLVQGACITITTPVKMVFMGGPGQPNSETMTVLVATYVGEALITVSCIEPSTGAIVYAPDANDPEPTGYLGAT